MTRNTGGTLVRHKLSFETHFVQIPNAYVRDRHLSPAAVGILAELMSYDDGYEVSLRFLADNREDTGIAAIRTAVENLESRGYLERQTVRGEKGTYGTKWHLTEPRIPLIEAVDNSAFENRTRRPTAFENRMNTACENRTQEEHSLRTLTKTSQSNPSSAHVLERQRTFARCPAALDRGGHELGKFGHCIHCHAAWETLS